MVRVILHGMDPYPMHLEQSIVDMMSAVAIEQQEHCAHIIRAAVDEYGGLDAEQILRLADVVQNHHRDEHGQTQITIAPE